MPEYRTNSPYLKHQPASLGWCLGSFTELSFNGKPITDVKVIKHFYDYDKLLTLLPNKVTCPICKKRFKPRLTRSHSDDCLTIRVPSHKVSKK